MTAELLNRATGPDTAAPQAAEELAAAVEALARAHYDGRRHAFDYGAAGVSREYQRLRAAGDALAGMEPAALESTRARRAFWLNTYNALLIHTVIARRLQDSVRRSDGFFDGPHYSVGGREMTLDAIEHGVLRANRRKYMSLASVLGSNDPRAAWALPRVDPRIHFGLYTASRSGPALRAFRGEDLDAQLEHAARSHLDHHVDVDERNGHLTLPMTFKWYAGDFGEQPEEIIDFVARRLPDDDRARVLAGDGGDLAIRYADYDWGLNDRYALAVAP